MSLRTCPECGARARTIDSRQHADHVTRRYQCTAGHRYSTLEHVVTVRRGKNTLDRLRQGLTQGDRADEIAYAAAKLRQIADRLAPETP
jgi:transcriptional regulator NrdR family protein